MALKTIRAKGAANITFKCDDSKSADAIAQRISAKYGETVQVKKIQPTEPQLKITKLNTDEEAPELIMHQLIESNPILRDMPYQIQQIYVTFPLNKEPYKNLVISTTLEYHNMILKKGSLIFNLSQSRLFEYVNLLMCARCLKYGHFARNCNFPPSCKKCSLNHPTTECIVTEPKRNMNCVNCIAANKRGAKYSIRHRPTDERCESRLERIAALKQELLSKN